jgi:hypothetical protein
MLSFQRRATSLPGAALFAFAAFAVHQLRYRAADGGRAGETLAHEGHGYLAFAAPLLMSLVGALVALALIGATTRTSIRSRPHRRRKVTAFVAFTVALAAVFAVQESAESLLCAGHPDGLGAVLGHGGWVALPLSAVFGTLLTLLLDTLAVVERRVTGRLARLALRAPLVVGRELRSHAAPLAHRALVFGFARRPPPGIASVT